MERMKGMLVAVFVFGAVGMVDHSSRAASLQFVGTQYDIGGTYYPGGSFPYVVVPWRSTSTDNIYAASTESPNQYYGRDGYALFATQYSYPDANVGYSSDASDPAFTDYFTDIIDLPDFVTDSAVLSARKAAGWAYALIDDPQLQAGIRLWTFDPVSRTYPPPDGTNTTGGIPYVKLGLLNGNDIFGNTPGEEPTARWGFQVGAGVPFKFRVGVMSGGLDNSKNAPSEVFLSQVVDDVPTTTIGSGELAQNRFVDMHFFDITGAQPGDQFVFSAMKHPEDGFSAGLSGFTFDVLPYVPLDGDFNLDGTVDAADYTVWRDRNGTPAEYDLWKMHFGESLVTGSGSAAISAIPEPTAWLMLLLGSAACFVNSRRRGCVS